MARSASKSKAKSAKGKAAKGKAGKKNQAKAKPAKTITAWDGTTKIVTATLPEIKKAEKGKGEMDSKKLVRVPSKAVRTKLIDEAARAVAARESLALPGHGGRPWRCDVKLVDDARGKKKMSGPLFRWYRGRLELAVLPHYLERIPEIKHRITRPRRHRDDPSSDESSEEESDDDEYPHVPRTSLQERQVTALSAVAWECPDHPVPTVRRAWTSPDAVTFHSRKAAMDHAEVLVKRDKLIDKVLHGFGGHGMMIRPAKPTRKVALEAGMHRFLRDGLWVVGQEEEWLEEAVEVWKVREENKKKREEREAEEAADDEGDAEAEVEAEAGEGAQKSERKSAAPANGNAADGGMESPREVTAMGLYIDANRDKLLEMEQKVSDVEKRTPGGASGTDDDGKEKDQFTVEAANRELRIQWEGLTEEVRQTWFALALHRTKEKGATNELDSDQTTQSAPKKQKFEGGLTATVPSTDLGTDSSMKASPASAAGSTTEGANPAVAAPPVPPQAGGEDVASSTPRLVSPLPTDTSDTANGETTEAKAAAASTDPSPRTIRRRPTKPRKAPKIVPSTHWRLTPAQIDACYSAVMDHYEKVMYTVKARNLYFELADGFDVLRERGRGRYDMELAAFDTPAFDFLTDLSKAAWMPVVRKILGDDAKLVHKGAFLSLPGSDTQIYHQDGPHLTTKYQRPCHAVNVFIPLVDLDERNGPTEFCLGTHYLGYDHHARDMCYTPTPHAGTPIIFDYRLGHRGLGNSSEESRPIVYLTYTPASKEFKDSVNFSRKRYKKIGDLVDKPLSRRERAMKRETDAAAEKESP